MPWLNRVTILITAMLAVPMVLGLAVLVAWDAASFWIAVAVAIIVVISTYVLIRPILTDIARTTAFLRQLEDGVIDSPPNPSSAAGRELMNRLGRVSRESRMRVDKLKNEISQREIVFDALPDPVLLFDRQRRVIRANRAGKSLFGDMIAGYDLALVLRNPQLLDAADKTLRGEPCDAIEFALPAPDDRRFRALVEPLPGLGLDGAAGLLTLHDVTELKRIEQMRADFVANASHELRTPLAAVLGFIETLQGSAKNDAKARERFLAIMHEQASRMSRLVADLLTLSRIELYEHTQPDGRANISALLKRLADGLELKARERNIAIDLELAADLPAVNGQDDELSQIFQNLLDNALKYAREGTKVEVVAKLMAEPPANLIERQGGAVSISVRDHGEGIAREHLSRLTERFFRVDPARSRQLGGTGLGLAIVKHAINRHRGLLTVESTPGEGSTFTVILPVARAPDLPPAASARGQDRAPAG